MGNRVYECKDGRMRIYIQEEKRVMSYPKYLMELELGRPLFSNEEVHHKDENPLNNDLSNLELRTHGEHQAEHSTKYHDTTAVCHWCGREFLWTSKQQRTFNGNRHYENKSYDLPFCSRQCSGSYGRQLQLNNYAEHPELCDKASLRKLTNEQVVFIRERYTPYDKEYGLTALADRFGVNKKVIDLILKGKTYKDVM